MTTTDWYELLRYAAWATVLVVVAILVTGGLAHWVIRWKMRSRRPPPPFMHEQPWCDHGRGWWGRLKAWFRRWKR